MIKYLWLQCSVFFRSDFGSKALWSVSTSAFERIVAVIQTILISRALGITEYGIYGMLFVTIGFVASVIGLQMGLTATVYVSRYRENEKEKAAAVISIVNKFGFLVCAVLLVVLTPFSQQLSSLLLGVDRYQLEIIIAVIFIGMSIISGIQDGVAQGFEAFELIAKLKFFISVCTISAIYPVAGKFGLPGVLCVILGALVLKFLIFEIIIAKYRKRLIIPLVGTGVSFRHIVGTFALPSMAVSLILGFVTWYGMFLLSRQQIGFDGVAIANTGLQWRGPVLMIAASLGAVAVPAFSRLNSQEDVNGAKKLRRTLFLINTSVATVVAAVLIVSSEFIMGLYGNEFLEGRSAFAMIILSTVPAIVSNVFMMELVGTGRMWRQLILNMPFVIVMGICFLVLVPLYGVNGYAFSLLVGSVIFLITILAVQYFDSSVKAKISA